MPGPESACCRDSIRRTPSCRMSIAPALSGPRRAGEPSRCRMAALQAIAGTRRDRATVHRRVGSQYAGDTTVAWCWHSSGQRRTLFADWSAASLELVRQVLPDPGPGRRRCLRFEYDPADPPEHRHPAWDRTDPQFPQPSLICRVGRLAVIADGPEPVSVPCPSSAQLTSRLLRQPFPRYFPEASRAPCYRDSWDRRCYP